MSSNNGDDAGNATGNGKGGCLDIKELNEPQSVTDSPRRIGGRTRPSNSASKVAPIRPSDRAEPARPPANNNRNRGKHGR